MSQLAGNYVQGSLRDSLSLEELTLAGLKGEKVLLPCNFATVFSGVGIEEEEVLGCGQFAGRLIWQSGKGNLKRPTPDKLSFGQYFEANARILNLLALEGQNKLEYLDFLRQVGILLQTFTATSVFCLDHLHRVYVHETGARWNTIENTLQNSVLKRKEDLARNVGSGGRRNEFSSKSASNSVSNAKVVANSAG